MIPVIDPQFDADSRSAGVSGEGSRRLADEVRTLDQLLVQLAQDAARQSNTSRADVRFQRALRDLTTLSEAAMVTTLLDRPVSDLHAQLGLLRRQLAWVIELGRRNGRCTAGLHQKLCQVMQRLQAFADDISEVNVAAEAGAH